MAEFNTGSSEHEYLRTCGYHVVTCMGCDEAILAVRYQVKAMKEAGTWK